MISAYAAYICQMENLVNQGQNCKAIIKYVEW